MPLTIGMSGSPVGGTKDYTQLQNKPQINSVTLTGNKSASDLGLDTPVAEVTTEPANNIYLPNTFYNLDWSEGGEKTIVLGSEIEGIKNEYTIVFNTGATAPTITWPTLQWKDGTPTVNAQKHYEISILKGYGVCVEFDLPNANDNE